MCCQLRVYGVAKGKNDAYVAGLIRHGVHRAFNCARTGSSQLRPSSTFPLPMIGERSPLLATSGRLCHVIPNLRVPANVLPTGSKSPKSCDGRINIRSRDRDASLDKRVSVYHAVEPLLVLEYRRCIDVKLVYSSTFY